MATTKPPTATIALSNAQVIRSILTSSFDLDFQLCKIGPGGVVLEMDSELVTELAPSDRLLYRSHDNLTLPDEHHGRPPAKLSIVT